MATISGLYRYAVKSLAGEALETARLDEAGLAGDRRYAFLDTRPPREGKVLTARLLRSMLTYEAHEEGARVLVTTPAGRGLDATSEELRVELEGALGRPLTLREAPGSNFDDAPLLLLNVASVRRLGTALGRELDLRRFRANILLEGMEADAEYGWIGRRLRAGSAVLEAVTLCKRCVMITYDPDTTEADPAVLREVTESRDAMMGVYCRVVEPGSVVLGDTVEPR